MPTSDDMRAEPVRKIGERVLLSNRRFRIVSARLKIRGKTVEKPFMRQNDCVELIAVKDNGSILLAKSYRPELNRYIYEFPAGTMKRGESPRQAAARELAEETGYSAKKITFLFSGWPAFGYTDGKNYFFLAKGLSKEKQMLEADESIDIEEVSPGKLLRMLKQGKIEDLNVLAAFHYYYYIMSKGRKTVRYKDAK